MEQALRAAALSILSQEGYGGLTLERVAAEAGVSKSSLYRRWRSKEALILAVFQALPRAVPQRGTSLEDDLVEVFGQFARNLQHSPLKGVLPRLAAECVSNPELATALAAVNEQRRAPIRSVLRFAVERGEITADTDLELAVDVIQGAIAIRLYFLLDTIDAAWIRRLARMIVGGLAPKERSRSAFG